MTPEGIEPPIFGSGIRRVTIAPWSHFFKKRSWSSGYDRRLPSDGPGFNSRRAQNFFLQKKNRRRRDLNSRGQSPVDF